MSELKANQMSKWKTLPERKASSFKWFDQASPLASSEQTQHSSLFEDLTFSFSEHFAFKHKAALTDLVKKNGGTVNYMLNDKCTHLVATQKEVSDNLSTKILQARKFAEGEKKGRNDSAGTFHIIFGEWIEECIRQGTRVKEYPTYDILAKLRIGGSKVSILSPVSFRL